MATTITQGFTLFGIVLFAGAVIVLSLFTQMKMGAEWLDRMTNSAGGYNWAKIAVILVLAAVVYGVLSSVFAKQKRRD